MGHALIDNYGAGSAILVRMHHCIADGIALARVMLSLTDEQPDAGIAPPDDGVAGNGGGPLGRHAARADGVSAAAAAWSEGVASRRAPAPRARR